MLATRSRYGFRMTVLSKLHGIKKTSRVCSSFHSSRLKLDKSFSIVLLIILVILGGCKIYILVKYGIHYAHCEIAVVGKLWNYVLLGLVECYLEEIQRVNQIACQQVCRTWFQDHKVLSISTGSIVVSVITSLLRVKPNSQDFESRSWLGFSEEAGNKELRERKANESGSASSSPVLIYFPSLSLIQPCIASQYGIGSVLVLPSNWFPLTRVKWFLGSKFLYGFRNVDCGNHVSKRATWSAGTTGSIIIEKRFSRVRSGSSNGSTSSELEARVCIQERNCLGQFARKLYGDF
ncbi:hypothetical protein Tco_0487382 [Tanacetum coccineum]